MLTFLGAMAHRKLEARYDGLIGLLFSAESSRDSYSMLHSDCLTNSRINLRVDNLNFFYYKKQDMMIRLLPHPPNRQNLN